MTYVKSLIFREITCGECGKEMLVVCEVLDSFDGRCGKCYFDATGIDPLTEKIFT